MINRDAPVTIDELHAYADNFLPADRREAVADWLARHPTDAAQVADWRAQAEAIRARYGAAVSEPVPARLCLDRLTRAQTRWPWRSIAAAVLIAAVLGGVAGWMARGASAAVEPSNFNTFTSDALEAHKLYIVEVRHPVEVPGNQRQHLVRWLSKRLDYQLRVPDLKPLGLTLIGGRLLPGPDGEASAFFMYEAPSGDRFTLYCAPSNAPATGMRYRQEDRFSSFYWAEHGLAYVLSGPPDRKRLWTVVKAAYDQVEKAPGPTKKKS